MQAARPWFVARKRFGWGWRPNTWQGWIVMGAYVAALGGLSMMAPPPVTLWVATAVLSAILLGVLVLTGTKPGGRLF